VIDKVIAHIEENKDANTARYLECLRIPCISTDPERKADMRTAAEWVQNLLAGCGFDTQIVDTRRHPAVVADSGPAADGAPTVLVYGHYDVQPTGDESLWHSPPFEPKVDADGTVYARGAADDKGQVLTHMLAAEAWMKAVGRLPIRVKFLIEGEEEIGSPNLEQLIRQHADRLACDYVALSDTPKFDASTPAITYGTKGMVYKEIIITGPKQDLHSGSYGGTITNPANALAAILTALRDSDNRVTIPGFYDKVREITDAERTRMNELPFDEKGYQASTGAPGLDGEKGFTTLERRWARPTLDVNGVLSGFIGEGASTIIPAKAMAKVSMRIVPDQVGREIADAFDAAVRKLCPPGVKLEILEHAIAPAYLCPLDSPGIAAAERALEAGYGTKPRFIREGGTLPILPLFKEVLGADSLMLGLCDPNCNAHGPNEFFTLADLQAGTRTAAHLFLQFAG
jgi:succinyl-diaminopimelate desuccinylase